jgi:hydroxymethylbilane synthase
MTTSHRPLRIGTRGSALAQAQVRLAVERLRAVHPHVPAPEVVVIKTTGDRVQDRPLAEIGGKGLFAKEIEAALLEGAVDFAVHSLKDLETRLPAGLVLAAVLPRADPRDALIAPAARSFADLPPRARVATGSIRRAAQLRALRPDFELVPLRGNVDTRLAKIRAGAAAATLLAVAGLARLGLAVPEATPLHPDLLLPAPCQGLIALQCRERDEATRALLAPLSDPPAAAAMEAERALLGGLDGSCKTPIGALAEAGDGALRLRALLARGDGTLVLRAERTGSAGDAQALGVEAAAELRARAPADLLAA